MIPEKKEVQAFAKQQGISGEYSTLLTNDKVGAKPVSSWDVILCH